ncbi:hypothetical protein BJV78DRAFT_1196315 [Lactifluus subvellereus]|nr:hypothetical protein BJV78DRAFT_1196315 [Lactifluus subvellereus]
MGADDDELPRRVLVTYRPSHSVEDEETVPDSEDSTSPGKTRPPDDEDSNLLDQPILLDRSDPPRPPRAVYRSRKRAVSPPSLSYTSVAPAEEVIPDSEDNTRSLGTSDDDDGDDNSKKTPSNARKSTSTGLSDWKQKLRDIDNEYDTDEDTQSPHNISSALSDPKGASLKDPFGGPSATQASSQHASHRPRADDSLSSPLHNVSSSTDTTPQFVFGTPQARTTTPPTSDGKPSPIPKTTARTKGKGKARAPPEAEEATMDDPLVPSPDGVRQTRRREKPNKSKVGLHFIFNAYSGDT